MVKQKMSQESVDLVYLRSGGCCERCGASSSLRWSIHHRQARGMGGSKDVTANLPANLLLLCGSGTEGCHGHIESFRGQAYVDGFLVHKWETPADIPVKLVNGWRVLDNAGGSQQ